MGRDRRITPFVFLGIGLLAGCRKAAPPSGRATAPSVSVSAPDRLAPGEAPPGQEKVYDLLMPRGAKIVQRFGPSVYVSVPTSPEAFANWVREQTDDPTAIVGPEATVFPKLHVRGADADHYLRVEVGRGERNDECSVIVDRREENVPPPPPMTNDEAMKKAGLTPDGKWIDPKHME